jgi:hypothetical protein
MATPFQVETAEELAAAGSGFAEIPLIASLGHGQVEARRATQATPHFLDSFLSLAELFTGRRWVPWRAYITGRPLMPSPAQAVIAECTGPTHV